MFAMLDPTTFPMAKPGAPLNVAFIATISSGADVPNATIVRETSKAEILNRLLSSMAPLTKKSPEMTKSNRPKKEKNHSIIKPYG